MGLCHPGVSKPSPETLSPITSSRSQLLGSPAPPAGPEHPQPQPVPVSADAPRAPGLAAQPRRRRRRGLEPLRIRRTPGPTSPLSTHLFIKYRSVSAFLATDEKPRLREGPCLARGHTAAGSSLSAFPVTPAMLSQTLGRVRGHQGDHDQVPLPPSPYPDAGGSQAAVGQNAQCPKAGSMGTWNPEQLLVQPGGHGEGVKGAQGSKQRMADHAGRDRTSL